MKQKIKIILADDQDLFRETLTLFLKNNQRLEVVAEAANGREVVDQLKRLENGPAVPDIILLDVEMPVMDGRTALEIIVKRFPLVKVIMLSAHQDKNLLPEFMSKGARSYLSKNCGSVKLFEAIEKVHIDGFYFDQSISQAMQEALSRSRSNTYQAEKVFKEKEIEIMKRICKGFTNKQIAVSLSISTSTVDFYKGKIYTKAECHNHVELMRYALKNDLLRLSEL
jgi:DNA-binding NarL/FixJ family response regulator